MDTYSKLKYIFPYCWVDVPMVRICLCYIVGIVYGLLSPWKMGSTVAGVVLICGCLLIFFINNRPNFLFKTGHLCTILYMIMVFLFGIFQWSRDNEARHYEKQMIHQMLGDTLYIEGIIEDKNETSFLVSANVSTFFVRWNGKQVNFIETLRLVGSPDDMAKIERGMTIKPVVRIVKPKRANNPGQYDEYEILIQQDIPIKAEVVDIKDIFFNSDWWWNRTAIVLAIDQIVSRLFSEKVNPVIKAMILGDKSDLSYEEKNAFSKVGLSHILVVSGLHVGFFLTPWMLLLSWLRRKTTRRIVSYVGLLVFLFAIVALLGWRIPMVRASLIASLIFASYFFQFPRNSLNILACAAFVILLVYPSHLFRIGFQLSFVCVLIVLFSQPLLRRWTDDYISNRFVLRCVQTWWVSLCISVGIMPWLFFYFGEASWISIFLNPFVIPLLALLIPITVLYMIIEGVLNGVFGIEDGLFYLGWLLNSIYEAFIFGVYELSRGFLTVINMDNPSWWLIAGSMSFFIAIYFYPRWYWFKKWLIIMLIFIGIWSIEQA